jgi:type I restriction enzyme, S subunit
MTAGLRPYPEYKDSGLLWLGQVPGHWEVCRNGRLFAQRNETGFGILPILEVSLKTGVRVRNMDELKRKQVMSDREKYKRAVKGDIAYNMMRMWQGAVGVAPVDGLVSPAYVVARPYPEVDPRYFSYLFRTDAYKNEVDGYSRGIVKDRNRLYWEDFKRILSCTPPQEEQKAIADYLDANAVEVRRFIRNRRRLIGVLNEQKQAIINRAVTRGLDPNIPLKPSGIEWRGDIPEHWEVVPLKRIAWFRSGAGFPVTEQGLEGLELPFFRVSDMTKMGNDVVMEAKSSTITRGKATQLNATIFPAGTIIFPKVGGALLTNKRRILAKPSCIDNNIMGCVVNGAERDFVFMLLRIIDLGLMCKPGPVPAIGEGEVREIRVPLPPQPEQKKLVEYERAEAAAIDALIAKARCEIDLIREYRIRLIADAVTGKVDVRHLAPPPEALADEAAPEDLDEGLEDEMLGEDETELVEEVADAND